jgi:hypothetical protein
MVMSNKSIAVLASLVALLAFSGIALADKQVRYVGIHPIPKAHGGGLCRIEAPHVHVFAPADKVQYRDHRGANHFVGDPVAYGYDGDRHAYVGHHPIHVDVVVGPVGGVATPDHEFCYIDGPHYHAFAPPPAIETDFELDGGAYFFVGTPPPAYVEARPAMIKVNTIYKPMVYARPVVVVEPPSAWIGVTYPAPVVVVETPPPPRARAAVVVETPAVVVRPPSIDVHVGFGVGIGGAVIVDDHHHHHHYKHKHRHKRGGGRWKKRDHRFH